MRPSTQHWEATISSSRGAEAPRRCAHQRKGLGRPDTWTRAVFAIKMDHNGKQWNQREKPCRYNLRSPKSPLLDNLWDVLCQVSFRMAAHLHVFASFYDEHHHTVTITIASLTPSHRSPFSHKDNTKAWWPLHPTLRSPWRRLKGGLRWP